jgi:hypothetical protein
MSAAASASIESSVKDHISLILAGKVSIGAQSGPRIGIQEGPHFSTL